jgi:hypothetical protein
VWEVPCDFPAKPSNHQDGKAAGDAIGDHPYDARDLCVLQGRKMDGNCRSSSSNGSLRDVCGVKSVGSRLGGWV